MWERGQATATDMKNDALHAIQISEIYTAIHINAEQSRTKNKLVNNARKTWALIIKTEGSTKYETSSGVYILDKNHPIILPRGASYSRSYLEQGECLVLEFQALAETSTLFPFEIADNSKLVALFNKIEKRLIYKPYLYQLNNLRDLYEILVILCSASEREYVPSKKYNMLTPAVMYIQEHYCERNIKNEQLADMCGISEAHFRAIFKQYFGQSPIAYVNRKRVERAKELLQSGLVSISQAANAVGCCNAYYFSRVFKQYTGLSPSDFLKQQSKEEVIAGENSNHST